ncbi:MAG: Tad domain-containing protein [Alphaproteobacteria bacterium]|nr:Tad domain-containing protein [Alphaproteobacteria bacterium]
MHFVGKALQALRDRRGSAAAIMALSAVAVLGAGGLATEATLWYTTKRRIQTAADAGAQSGALHLMRSTQSLSVTEAVQNVVRNGYSAGPGTTVSVFIPPNTGPYAGRGGSAEVVVRARQPRLFSGLFMANDPFIQARAVATTLAAGPACALALDPTMSQAITFEGSSVTDAANCLLATNSTHPGAFNVQGGATVNAYSLYSMGGITFTGGGTTVNTAVNPISYGARPIPDPYASVPDPTPPGACTTSGNQQITGGGWVVFNSGSRFCGGLRVGRNASQTGNIDLRPGVYYVTDGDLEVNANSRIRCSTCVGDLGVTIIFTGVPANIGGPKFNGNAEMQLQAPATGTYAGLLFYQDRRAIYDPNDPSRINGNFSSTLEGAIYFANGAITVNGSVTQNSDCFQMVSRSIELTGNANLRLGLCASRGVQALDVLVVRLVE